jgi:hypothetical protein
VEEASTTMVSFIYDGDFRVSNNKKRMMMLEIKSLMLNMLRWNKVPLRSGSTIYQVSFFISLQ